MKITEMLELEEISLIEPMFSDLVYPDMDEFMVQRPGTSGKILVDEDERPVIFAQKDENDGWIGCCTLLREPSLSLIEHFEQFDCDMYQEDNEIAQDAIRNYFSTILCSSVQPGPNDLNPARVHSIESLLKKTIGTDSHQTGLDCCCGTGVGAMVMEQYGMHPLAFDNDESLLVRGMMEKRLRPERIMWIDGRMISHYLTKKVSIACGFMIGEIHSFNAHIWQEIISATCLVSDNILFTTGTEPEINLIKEWVLNSGKKAEIFESDSDPIYDRWVCYSE
ncbi:hypothetical protein [Methanospirillum purgamenti]|jgi:hypothetical protein|uniref:Uncharacterized protein n=1 Tax=Methanospirillum hungatei TaxID=2203 RepID=A0A8F5VKV9_METHU|nr:hypothetical protein [Methanospirillum hungatei]QXO93668.1 hypothetical protein KSK55_09855 [Methanospirillum hungatei]